MSNRDRRGRPLFDSLEPRRLLSETPGSARLSASGTLLVTGTSGNDSLIARFNGGSVLASINGNQTSFTRADVRRIAISGGAGNDVINNKTTLASTLAGEAGNDRLFGGRGRDTQLGGDGADRIFWSPGNDQLIGGVFGEGGEPADDGGIDYVDYSAAPVKMRVEPFGSTPTPGVISVAVSFERLPPDLESGTVGAEYDFLSGTVERLRMTAFDDSLATTNVLAFQSLTVFCGAGNDEVYLVTGNATVDAEGGDDYIGGADTAFVDAYGGPGDDTLAADPSTSAFDLGEGQNWLEFNSELTQPIQLGVGGIRNLFNVRGRDDGAPVTIIGDDGPNVIMREGVIRPPGTFTGPVRIFAGNGDDSVVSSDGDDYIDAGAGNDTVYGEGGDDTLVGGVGRDKLYGGDGDDHFLTADGRRDTVRGGVGTDSAAVDDIDLVTEIENLS
jgi:Ca2+-binding RTX toxin-like protein